MKIVTSVTMVQENSLCKDALSRLEEVDMELSSEREKPLDHNFASVKKELAGLNEENASLC